MKKLAIIALAFITLQATAQKKANSQREGRDRTEKFQNISAEDMATLQTKKMTLHSDLNEKQQKAIKALNLENATTRKAKMEARKASKEKGSIQKPSQEDRVKMMNERLDHQIAMKAKMKNILNEEQFEKWEKQHMRNAHNDKGSKRRQGKSRKAMQKQG
ncbi:hypothetical protein ACFFU9_05225 [Mariniflexile ostreae]|uniref:LTXXQ motif family protein n=1 Tax=Mariniflexile ostreae TaxID=1520892 RepID=A0ABV5F9L0_9FLAO